MSVGSKSELRSILRKTRQDFVKKQKSSSLFDYLSSRSTLYDVIHDAEISAGYLPIGSEVDIRAIMTSSSDHGLRWALPWLDRRESPMQFRLWEANAPLETAPGGFQQPKSLCRIVSPGVILLPLVGFDRSGNRLGQGAGHYDRALERLPDAIRIGIAWSVQEADHIPADPWDVPLDAIQTEAEWIVPANSRLERA